MNPYSTLDIQDDASDETIKKAYRAAAHRTHPDKPGGSNEAFHEVGHAYDVLKDPARRQKYDTTGDASDLPRVEEVAAARLVELFTDVIRKDVQGDVLEYCRISLDAARQEMNTHEAIHQRAMAKMLKQAVRLDTVGDINVYEGLVRAEIDQTQHKLSMIEMERKVLDLVETLMADYTDTGASYGPFRS